MKTATVRQLRHNFGSVLAMIECGEEVTITRRNKPVARLTVPAPTIRKPIHTDFAARLAARFPEGGIQDRPLAERISEERDRY
jgi:prevent-host-death family protein